MVPVGAAAKEVKSVFVVQADAPPEAVGVDGGDREANKSAVAAPSSAVHTSVIGSLDVGSDQAATADVDAVKSATVLLQADAGACSFPGADAPSGVIARLDLLEESSSSAALKLAGDLCVAAASGEFCAVKGDMQLQAGELLRKRKRAEEEPVPPPMQEELQPVAPPNIEEEVHVPSPIQEEQEPVPAPAALAPAAPAPPLPSPYEELEESDGSLEYDSQDSSESVDSRNIGSFKRKLLNKLDAGNLPFKKRGMYFCPWHQVKPKGGKLENLRQHCEELAYSGTSKQIRAEHQGLLMVLPMEDDA